MTIKKNVQKIFGIKRKKDNLFKDFDPNQPYDLKPSHTAMFVTGAGRSGTHFFAEVFGKSANIQAYHLDDVGDSLGDSFEFFRKYYNLNLSNIGFIQSRKFLIWEAHKKGLRYLESNPLISLSIGDISNSIDSQFIFSVRNPKEVIESHYRKGWYKDFDNQVPSYQYWHDRPNHYFSRVVPKDKATYKEWLKLSRLSKITWMWSMTYANILSQVKKVDHIKYKFLYLDDFSHERYLQVCEFLGINDVLSYQVFNQIVCGKPGKSGKSIVKWSDVDKGYYNSLIPDLITSMDLDTHLNAVLID